MRDRLIANFLATSAFAGAALLVGGLVIMHRENKLQARVLAADTAFHQQMKEYECDPRRRTESIIFWKQIIDDNLI